MEELVSILGDVQNIEFIGHNNSIETSQLRLVDLLQ